MTNQIANNLFTIQIPLPENPLKWLNSYIFIGKGTERNLIVDTGFNRPECYNALMSGLSELSVELNKTDVFLTHLHSDHTGNAAKLAEEGCRILMGELDYTRFCRLNSNKIAESRQRVSIEGMSGEELRKILDRNPAVLYAPNYFEAQQVQADDVLSYGEYELKCILTPGHTPGHICLYDEAKGLILLGDHVLFDITPNIIFWTGVNNSLKDYMDSLEKIKRLSVKTALPAHRNCGNVSLAERVDQLVNHHDKRLAELETVIKSKVGLNANELAGQITWKIRAHNWDDFPPAQKWFAICETIAHLDFLVDEGRVVREYSKQRDCWIYSV